MSIKNVSIGWILKNKKKSASILGNTCLLVIVLPSGHFENTNTYDPLPKFLFFDTENNLAVYFNETLRAQAICEYLYWH